MDNIIVFFKRTFYIWLLLLCGVTGYVLYKYYFNSAPLSSGNSPDKRMSTSETQTTPGSQNTFLNIPKIAKKSKAVVDAYLGPPNHHESINPSNAPCPCEKYYYKDGNIEIVFMKDVADWIIVNHMNSVKFDKASILESLGLPVSDPAVHHEGVMKWNDFNGFDQLSAFEDENGGLSYIYLKANTH